MVKKSDYIPPITYMIIDTDGKTVDEMKSEVTKLVIDRFDKRISELESIVDAELYNKIKTCVYKERDRMIKSFVYQIEHLNEIKESDKNLVKSFLGL